MPSLKKKQLAKILSNLECFDNPKVELEQYTTPGDVAAELLWIAHINGDIAGKIIADLGTGTGVLAIGASLLGADIVYGIDRDDEALEIAQRNIKNLNLENITLIHGDVSFFSHKVDTVIMNPPFGCQNRNADRPFLEKACESEGVIYSIHPNLEEVRGFVEMFLKEKGFGFYLLKTMSFEIPHQFYFHKKKLGRIEVCIYRFEKLDRY